MGKKAYIIHPFVLAVFPILFLYSHNIVEASFLDTLAPMAVSLAGASLLFYISRLILKDRDKGALVTSLFLLLFYSYGHIYTGLKKVHIEGLLLARHRYSMLICLVLFALGYFLVIKRRKNLEGITTYLNICAVILVTTSVLTIGIHKIGTRHIREEKTGLEGKKYSQTEGDKKPGIDKPQKIYYIIVDGHASSETLKKVYGYDNSEFIEYLKNKGFYVASQSRSNYALTYLSISSSLNMRYNNDLIKKNEDHARVLRTMEWMIQDNEVVQFLKSQGYAYAHIASGWGVTDRDRFADRQYAGGYMNEFLRVLCETTMLAVFVYNYEGDLRGRILFNMNTLKEIPKLKGTYFIFSHLVIPHPPMIFGRNGEKVVLTSEETAENDCSAWTPKDRYVDQLIFVEKKIKEVIETILSESDTEPIIVLQADHGSSSYLVIDQKSPAHVTREMMEERMGILNAYYLPHGGSRRLYESITPVNSFRLIFDHYFGAHYGLLKDAVYYSSYEDQFEFTQLDYEGTAHKGGI